MSIFIVVALGFVVAALIAVYVGSIQLAEERRRPDGSAATPWECTTCHAELLLHPSAFAEVTGEESALVVQNNPAAYNRKLGEIQCERCQTHHVFITDKRTPIWVLSDTLRAGGSEHLCTQCRRTLIPPPWPPGARDYAVHKVTDAPDNVALVCSRCDAVCCIPCVLLASRGRSKDGTYLCPRCYRKPVERFYHF